MKEIEGGFEHFDGKPVEAYEGRFSGSFDIDFDDGIGMSSSDLVCFVVTARVATPKFSKNKLNQVKRTNVLKIEEVQALSKQKAQYLLDEIGKKINGVNDGFIEPQGEVEEQDLSITDIPTPFEGPNKFPTLYTQFVGQP